MYRLILEKELEHALNDPAMKPLAVWLGCDSALWRTTIIRMAYASPYVAALLPSEPEKLDLLALATHTAPDDGKLVLSVPAPPLASACFVANDKWPFMPTLQVEALSAVSCMLTLGTWQQQVKATVTDNEVTVEWPRELGLYGCIDCTDKPWEAGTIYELAVQPVYPTALVANALITDHTLYEILEEAGYVGAVFQFSDPIERIAIAVLALHTLVTRK